MRHGRLAWVPVGAVGLLGAPAIAQAPASDRLERLEMLIAEQTAALEALREEHAAAKASADEGESTAREGSPVSGTAAGYELSARPAGCTLKDEAARSRALAAPGTLMTACFTFPQAALGPEGVAALDAQAAASYQEIASAVPGRSLSPTGITPQIAFGNESEASMTVGSTSYWRDCRTSGNNLCSDDPRSFASYSPGITNLSVTLSAKLDQGVGKFASVTGSDFDLTSEAKIRAELSRAHFAKVDRGQARTNLAAFVERIRKACSKATDTPCLDDAALDWLRLVKEDSDAPGGVTLVNAELVQEFSNSFFRAPEGALPRWGYGVGGELGKKAIAYLAGLSSIGPDPDNPGKNKLFTDLSRTPTAMTSEKVDFKFDLHLFYAFGSLRPRPQNRAWPSRAVVVGQLAALRDWRLPDGSTDISVCDVPAGTTVKSAARLSCAKLNVAAPIRFDEIVASAEVRLEWQDLRLLKRLGFAPKVSYGLLDGGVVFDFPLYIGTDLEGGVRVTHSFDGRDLLGNAKDPDTTISIFFTPLKFDTF